jgi:hypothetical protein
MECLQEPFLYMKVLETQKAYSVTDLGNIFQYYTFFGWGNVRDVSIPCPLSEKPGYYEQKTDSVAINPQNASEPLWQCMKGLTLGLIKLPSSGTLRGSQS